MMIPIACAALTFIARSNRVQLFDRQVVSLGGECGLGRSGALLARADEVIE